PDKKEEAYVVLKNASIIDAIGDAPKTGSILLRGEKIMAIDYTGSKPIPDDATTYDLTGKFIIPGIIDGHVHITHGTEQQAKEHLLTALQNGVTGVRDMGGDGRVLTLLKKNMQIGEDLGPDIFFGTIIAGPKFFETDKRPQSVALGATAGEVSWQRAITKNTDFKQIIAEVKGLGATAIKCYANLDAKVLELVSDEAKKQGLKVWGHAALYPAGPSEVVDAGVEVVSHAGLINSEMIEKLIPNNEFKSKAERDAYLKKNKAITWNEKTPKMVDLFNLMKRKNCILDATLYVYTMGLDKANADSTRFKKALKVVRIAHNNGIKILAGSDHMIDPQYNRINIHKEMELLTEAGLSNIDAIKAATINNAEAVGEEKNVGTIESNKLANLVILNSNPLEDIKNTKDIKMVIKRGKVIDPSTLASH
ncbi:hypothetical protein EYV94_10985, partial [Puteibacter caeruleilacunae]